MSNCSVKGCKTRKRAGDDNVSFHRFPNSEPYFSQWLQACGRGDWKPPSVHSRVCSKHFNKDLLIKSESVTFLVTGAVPTKFVHVQSGVKDEMTNLNKSLEKIPDAINISPTPSEIIRVCRVCLRTDRKVFNLLHNNLNSTFEHVTNLKIGDDLRPKTLCWECAHRLSSCNKFIHLARHTDSLLATLLADGLQLTTENLNKLKTDKIYTWELSKKSYSSNYIDLATVSDDNVETEHADAQTDPMQEDAEAETEVKVKEEMDDELDDSLFRSYDTEKFDSDERIFTHRLKITSTNGKVKRKHRQPEKLDPDTFATTSLSIEEQMKEIASRKESENYKNSPFKCDECYKGFLDESVYGSHMVRHSDECGSFICDVCKLHFHSVRALRHHHTSHMHRFSCKRCPFVTPRRYAAKLHNEYHNGTRYNCPKCSETFGKFSTYLSHLRIKHPSDYVCALCGHSFVSDKGLALHRSLKHRFDQRTVTGDGPKCAECDISFVSDDALEQHYKVSSKHEDRRASRKDGARGRAPEPVQRKPAKEDLVKSMRRIGRHRVKGPITCEQCDKQLPNSLAYHWHFRNSHPDKNRTNYPAMPHRCMCEVCGKMFQSLALLQDHSTCHAGTKQFECAQCGKRFARRYRLVAHRRLHGGARPRHACARCARAFSTLSNLQRHAASHSTLRPHRCAVCGKGFKHASLMKDHVKYVHLKTPWPKRRRAGRSEGKVTNQMGGGGDEANAVWES